MVDKSSSLAWQGSGDARMEPGQFLREIDNKIDNQQYTTEAQKVKCFRNNIAYGSAADEWFSSLDKADTTTYEKLTEAFEKQWPLTAAPKASRSEQVLLLKEWKLKPEELGKKVEGPGGSEVWSHVKWATGLMARVRAAKDDDGFLLDDVYSNLPRPVRDLIRSAPKKTYEELVTAVLALDTSDLREVAADYSLDAENTKLLRQAPPSPTKALRDALSSTHLQTPQRPLRTPSPALHNVFPYQNVPVNPFQGQGGRGNLFAAPPRPPLFPSFRGGGPGALGMGGIGHSGVRGPALVCVYWHG